MSHEAPKDDLQLKRLFNLSLDLLCVAGTDGYFKHTNPAFERVLGYEKEELLSCSFIEFVHPDDRESTLKAVERLAQGIPVVDFENRYRTKAGEYRWLAWRSTPKAELGLIYAVARDITDQKRTEEMLQQRTADLERSNQDLEEFAAVASHDLRAPLRSIANLAEWIEEDMKGQSPAAVQENLGKLRGQARRLELVIDDLLALARAGRKADCASEVDVEKLLEETVLLLHPPAGLVVRAEGGLPVFQTDRAALQQVFRNLIGNAVKHHDRSEGQISISVREDGDSYQFCVADDGPGIPSESQQIIFEKFQRLQAKDDVEGTGIGLALVKRIVEGYSGRVWVESDGRGSAFWFSWPKQLPD